MGQQTFRDESNRKHGPHTKHYVEDDFGKGTTTRNWKDAENKEAPRKPPGAPDRTPVESPQVKSPMKGPKKPSEEKEKLKGTS